MHAVKAYLSALVGDPLFIRMCMLLWGTTFAAFGAALVVAVSREAIEGLALVLLALAFAFGLGGMGLVVLGTAMFGSDAKVETASKLMADSDLPGVVFAILVIVFALPLTALLRAMGRRPGSG